MVARLKINILAYGSQLIVNQLADQVDSNEFSLSGCTQRSELFDLLQKDSFHLVIIDHEVQDLDKVCQAALLLADAPVAVILRKQIADWNILSTLAVDGYLPEDAGKSELAARIKACLRRQPFRPSLKPYSNSD